MSLKVTLLDSVIAREIVEREHYLHRKPQVLHAFGLLNDEEVKGVCTFGNPTQSTQLSVVGNVWVKRLYVIELNRLWVNDNEPRNTESWFVSRCLKMIPTCSIVVSYADTGQGHEGYVYRALNFNYAGTTADGRGKLYDYVMPDQGNKHPRGVKWGTPGAIKVERSVKNKYWTVAGGNRTERKKLEACVRWEKKTWK